jgi:hypothetical protein
MQQQEHGSSRLRGSESQLARSDGAAEVGSDVSSRARAASAPIRSREPTQVFAMHPMHCPVRLRNKSWTAGQAFAMRRITWAQLEVAAAGRLDLAAIGASRCDRVAGRRSTCPDPGGISAARAHRISVALTSVGAITGNSVCRHARSRRFDGRCGPPDRNPWPTWAVCWTRTT